MYKKTAFFLTVVLGVALLLPFMAEARRVASPIDTWTKTNTFASNLTAILNAVADNGSGTYVAVGNGGVALRSTDTVNWKLITSASTSNKNLLGVAYGSVPGFTGFIAVGDNKTVSTSAAPNEGTSWSASQPTNIVGNLKAITFGNGMFVAVGDSGGVFTSSDGSTWTRRAITSTSPTKALTTASLQSVIYAPSQGRFTAVGAGGTVLLSYDGIYWYKEIIQSGGTLTGVAFGQVGSLDIYAAVNSAGTVFISIDGLSSWYPYKSAATSITAGGLNGITFASGKFAVVGKKGIVFTSDNGITWTGASVPTNPGTGKQFTNNIKAVGANSAGTVFYAAGELGTVLTTTISDTDTYRIRSTSNTAGRLTAAAFGSGTFVTAGQYGNIFTSSAGASWAESRLTREDDNGFPFIEGITFGGGLFVAVGDADSFDTVTPFPVIYTSPDGLTWTQQFGFDTTVGAAFTNKDLYGVAFGAGTYVAVGTTGTVMNSTNGITWTANAVSSNDLNGITFGSGNFVAVGNKGTIVTSTNGTTWQTATAGTTVPNFQAVAFGNSVFVAVASNGNVYTASNPAGTWTKTSTNIAGSFGVAYGTAGSFTGFVAVGSGGAIWESQDGTTWLKVTGTQTTSTLEGVAFGNGAIVASGGGSIIITKNP